MNTLEEYLKKTETAAQTLFEGIDKYLKIIDVDMPIFSTSTEDTSDIRREKENWEIENADKIGKWEIAERHFLDESFAMATLCGAVLQLAYMAIKQYSNNCSVPERFNTQIKGNSTAVKFCIGREIQSVQIGLIIYAGRNQAAHYDDELREPNRFIFERLSKRTSRKGVEYINPAFDLENAITVNFAGNITHLLGWRSYDAYLNDMRELLSKEATHHAR